MIRRDALTAGHMKSVGFTYLPLAEDPKILRKLRSVRQRHKNPRGHATRVSDNSDKMKYLMHTIVIYAAEKATLLFGVALR